MTIHELIVLLPCHSLEDFPQYHEGDQAAELLTGWTALWHPALVAACGKLPRWFRADFPPDDCAGRVLLVPSLSDRLIAAGWKDRVRGAGAVVEAAGADCLATAAMLCERTGQTGAVDDALIREFLAFGYCYLQVELLTRQMRYMSSLDEPHVENQLVLGARAAMAGDAQAAREHLRKCFDVLMEARDRFYPVDSYLLDLALTAESLVGEPLRAELTSPTATNVYLTGELVEHLAERVPESYQALREAIASDATCVVGGDYTEQDLPLMPLDAIEIELSRAQEVYQRLLGRRVRVYGRRRAGLTPLLPMVLSRAGFVGCVHCTFDDGAFPPIGQSKTRWQGLDGSAIDAFGRVPLDARLPGTFLSLSQKLAESMDLDHVAAVALVHWPGETSFWMSLVKLIAGYAPILGKFATLEHFFEQTDSTGRLDKYEVDDYRHPYLQQSVARGEADPISRHIRAARHAVAERGDRVLGALATMAAGDPALAGSASEQLALAITGSKESGDGTLTMNPLAHEARRIDIESRGETVAVPGLGFVWQSASHAPRAGDGRKAPRALAEDNVLANEFMQVTVDPETGGIRSVRDFKHRGNRLSQQLALRLPSARVEVGQPWRDPDEQAHYSVMVADRIEAIQSGPPIGELLIEGRLVNQMGTAQAQFTQRLRLAAGSRLLVVDIHIDPQLELAADPWGSYFACRFAWSDESAEYFRSLHGTRQPTTAKRFEAPRFFEICEEQRRTAIVTGGLPFHRRVGYRMLDSLLMVRNETCRDFRLGVGIDLPDLGERAEELLLAELPQRSVRGPEAERSGWFFHIDGANIVALDWAPLVEEGAVRGFRAKLLETAGRPGRVKLRAFKPVGQAMQVDAQHNPIVTLSAVDDTILIDFSVFELVEIEARWATS